MMSVSMSQNIPSMQPNDVKATEWRDDMKEWPSVEYGDIYNYLILNHASDGFQMKNYKSLDSFNYFKSGSVGRVMHYNFTLNNDNFVLLKSDVRPSQKTNAEFHKAWVTCSAVGTIYNAGCSCMAGKSMSCSHVGALLWKIEYAVRRGLTVKSCTDEQIRWNKGTSRNLEPGIIKEMDFKKPKVKNEVENGFAINDESNNIQNSKSSFHMFTNHTDLISFVDKSAMKPLFLLKNSIIYKSVHAEVSNELSSVLPDHSEHLGDMSCQKCTEFYEKFVSLTKSQIDYLQANTIAQSNSSLWHDSRRIRITGSSAHKVPIRETTNPDNFMREHLYPTFMGNMFTKMGLEGEIQCKQKLREDGINVKDVGTMVLPDEPWLSVSPDGFIDSGNILLEIKCPFLKDDMKLDDLFTTGKYDVINDAGNLILRPNGPRGYFLQVQLTMHVSGTKQCKLVLWSSTCNEYRMVKIPYDSSFCENAIKRLRHFYFSKFLPRIVDDFNSGRLNIGADYIRVSGFQN